MLSCPMSSKTLPCHSPSCTDSVFTQSSFTEPGLNCKLTRPSAWLTASNDILESEGVVPDYEDGIRITDAKTLQVARVSRSYFAIAAS